MKKTFILFMAMVVAVALSAAPQIKLAQLSTMPQNELLAHTPQQTKALQRIRLDANKRIAPHNNAVPANKTAAAEQKHVLQNLQKAAAEPIILNADGFLVGPEYEAETGEWYVAFEAQGYTFRLCWYGEEDDCTGSFVFEDISWEYTWGWYQSDTEFYEIYPSDITMTVSEKQIGECLKQIVLDATIWDLNNDRIYQANVVHSTYTPKSTVESVLNNGTVTMDYGYYVLQGNNNELDMKLTVISDVIEGEYTHASFDMSQTKIVYNGVEQKMLQGKMSVMLSELENGNLGYKAALSFYNQDTVLHKIDITVPLPAAKDTIQVECHNLSLDNSLAAAGFMMLFASNKEYDIFAMYEGEDADEGVYDVALTVTDKSTWMDVASIRGTLTLTLAEDAESWEATIEAYCSDYNWYSIDMNFEVPVPTDTVQVKFESSAMASFRPDQLNMVQLMQYAEDYEASITIYNIGLDESFSKKNVILDYTEFYDWTVESSVEIADIKGVLSQRGDTTVINASYIGFNAVQYDVEFWYTVPQPVDTVEIEMPIKFTNAMDEGYYILSAYTPDSAVFISLSPITETVAGTFINDGLFGKFGAEDGRYDFYSGNTFIYVASEWKNYTIEKGELVVEHAADGTITAEAKFIARNAVYYHIKMTSEYNTHLDFDEPEQAVDRTYTTADNVTIDDQSENNGYIYLALTAADGSDMAAFFFFVEEADEDIIVPAGVYPINSSEKPGTVYANPGVQGNGVFPSYYAQLLGENLVIPLWLLVDGTVEVAKTEEGYPSLEVNAVNSYGVEVHIVYDGTPLEAGVKDIPMSDVDTRKVMRDGQLLIIRQNQTFNILGVSL